VTPAFDIRRLTYSDLPQVIAIERRAFPTPWSLAMFVLELSKPSGICLTAVTTADASGARRGERDALGPVEAAGDQRAGDLLGYLICSRYDTVWHLMNVAIDPGARRRRIATTLLTRLFDQVGDPDARYTLEVRRSNAPAIELYERFGFRAAGVRRRYYQDNGEDAVIMWRTAATRSGGGLGDAPGADPRVGLA
jgi:[ribosomal protein S18]-alanine N-acetyltransferase